MIELHKTKLKSGVVKFYFTVISRNKKVLVTSQMYSRKANAQDGITALCTLINEGTEIVDLT